MAQPPEPPDHPEQPQKEGEQNAVGGAAGQPQFPRPGDPVLPPDGDSAGAHGGPSTGYRGKDDYIPPSPVPARPPAIRRAYVMPPEPEHSAPSAVFGGGGLSTSVFSPDHKRWAGRGPDPDRARSISALPLWLAGLASLLLHVSIGWAIYDTALGRVDQQALHDDMMIVRVERAADDLILPQDAPQQRARPRTLTGAGGTEGGTAATDNTDRPSKLVDMSLSLLSGGGGGGGGLLAVQPMGAPGTGGAGGGGTDPRIALRGVPDAGPRGQLASPAPGVPHVNLPQGVLDRLAVRTPLEVNFVGPGKGKGDPGRGGAGASAPASGTGIGAGSASGQARSLLAGAGPGPMGPGRGLGPPGLGAAGGGPGEARGVIDQRLMNPPLSAPPIDFTRIALAGAGDIAIPEHLDNDFEYVVTRWTPPDKRSGLFGFGSGGGDARSYLRVDITGKRSLHKLKTMPKDVVFLVDTSGSISQIWVDHIVRGVRDSLNSLNAGDRFNIVFFNESPQFFSTEGPQPVNEQTLARAVQFLTGPKSGGYTDVNRAMSRLLVRDVAVERVYNMVLISDGVPTRGVMDTRELINLITRDNDLAASIYCVGVGRRQNRTLLEFLAYRNKGFCLYAGAEHEAASLIRDLLSRLRYPIMKDIQLSVMGLPAEELFPRNLPNIHQGETFSIYGRFEQPAPFTMRLMGHNGHQLFDFTFTRRLDEAPAGNLEMGRSWAFWKLHNLYDQMLRAGETQELRAGIDDLRRQYRLKVLYGEE